MRRGVDDRARASAAPARRSPGRCPQRRRSARRRRRDLEPEAAAEIDHHPLRILRLRARRTRRRARCGEPSASLSSAEVFGSAPAIATTGLSTAGASSSASTPSAMSSPAGSIQISALAAEQAHRAGFVGEQRRIGLDGAGRRSRTWLAPSASSSRCRQRSRLRLVGPVEQVEADRRGRAGRPRGRSTGLVAFTSPGAVRDA